MAARIFFSYSHDDEEQRNQLEKHLALSKRQGLIESWHDRRIVAGEAIDQAIDAELERADIILLLVSSSFIASDYCFSKEMARALERHERGEARIVPVIVRNCDWHSAPFGKLKAVPKDGKPIASWAHPDDAYTDVAREVRSLVESLGATREGGRQPVSPVCAVEGGVASKGETLPRSGNLRVKQQFSELDRSRFLDATYQFIVRYFDGSLTEFAKRNSDVETHFQKVDAVSFTAVVYRNGKRVSSCAVRLNGAGSPNGGITYSQDSSRTDGNGYNERLSVEADDQSLFLRTMGMASGGGDKGKLSQEGAAEVLWGMLVGPLQ